MAGFSDHCCLYSVTPGLISFLYSCPIYWDALTATIPILQDPASLAIANESRTRHRDKDTQNGKTLILQSPYGSALVRRLMCPFLQHKPPEPACFPSS